MKTLLLLSCLWSEGAAQSAEALTNAAVLELVRAGLSDQAVVQLIDSRDNTFDVSVSGLIALKKSGVSNALIQSMLAASGRSASSDANAPLPGSIPEELGVYWEANQGLQRLPAENVTLRGPRGFETDTAALGGTSSAVALKPPLTFVIRTPDDVAAEEYVLVQLFIRKDRREFRTIMGGMRRSDGLERMAVPFQSERLARNLYRLRVVALPKGEFGFVRPGTQLPTTAAASRPDSPSGLVVPARPGTTLLSDSPSAGAVFTFSVR